MALAFGPTAIDRKIAHTIADHSSPPVEDVFNILTLAGDERVVFAALVATAVVCLGTGAASTKTVGRLSATTLAAAAIVHLAKHFVDQPRPDRIEAPMEGAGIRHAGNAYDAFPSGHAVYMGAIASALSHEAPRFGFPIWVGACAVASTRVVILAHWLSDVVIGLVIGAVTERLVRLVTKLSD